MPKLVICRTRSYFELKFERRPRRLDKISTLCFINYTVFYSKMLTYLQLNVYYTLPPAIALYVLMRPLLGNFNKISRCIGRVSYNEMVQLHHPPQSVVVWQRYSSRYNRLRADRRVLLLRFTNGNHNTVDVPLDKMVNAFGRFENDISVFSKTVFIGFDLVCIQQSRIYCRLCITQILS